MGCLLAFVMCNLITVVLNLVLNNDLQIAIAGIALVTDDKRRWPSQFFGAAVILHCISLILALIGQSVGAWFGWGAYTEAQSIGTAPVQGADWGQDGGWGTGGGRQGGGGGTGNSWGTGTGRSLNRSDVEMAEQQPRQQ